MADPADIQRLIGDLAREGTVASVDLSADTARVRLADDLVTGDLPWLAARMGAMRVWSPPAVGEQVLVICPEADGLRGIIIGSLACDAFPAPDSAAYPVIAFADGAHLSYDPDAHYLTASLPAASTLDVKAETIFLHGTVHVDGDVAVTGKVTAGKDVIGGGKSLRDHVHTKVQVGGAMSGPPQ